MGNLLGRAVGGMLRSAVGAMAEQMQAAAAQVADVQDRAARLISGDARVSRALGGSVRVGAPMSQSSMSQSINGRVSKTVTLLVPVAGATGQAQVCVGGLHGGAGRGCASSDSVRLAVWHAVLPARGTAHASPNARCATCPLLSLSPHYTTRLRQAQVRYVEDASGGGGSAFSVAVLLPNGQTVELDGSSSSPSTQTIDVEVGWVGVCVRAGACCTPAGDQWPGG